MTSTPAGVPSAEAFGLATVTQQARDYAAQAAAPNTQRAHRADWQDFTAWCDARGLASLPAAPETVGLYVTDLAQLGRKAATIARRVSTISQAHQTAGHETPTRHAGVRAVLAGIRRQHGTAQAAGIPYGSNPATCPVRALRAWRAAAGVPDGPLFRIVDRWGHIAAERLNDRAVARAVQRAAAAAGLDPANYAAHSLRAGLATSAAAAGVSERAIMAQTGHKSVTIARRYIREGSLFRENAAAGVGL